MEGVLDQIEIVQTPEQSVEEIRNGIKEARSLFRAYRLTLLSVQELTASVKSSEIIDERKQLEETTAKRKEFLDSVIKDSDEQIKSLLLEAQSIRSSTTGSINSVTSTRLKAKAKAAATVKKAELHKQRIAIESRSALLIEEEELALARRKRSEKARLEALRLDEEAAIALAKAKAIEDELQLSGASVHSQTPSLPNLPQVNPKERVQKYLDSHEEPFCLSHDITKGEDLHSEQKHHPENEPGAKVKQEPDARQKIPFYSELNPNSPPFTPTPDPVQTTMGTYIEFMARRELISNKIEKFDDRPENYHTWRGSFENMIAGVKISPSEQLSLIIEYTTNESKRLAQRLRNAYIDNPGEGLKEVWCKLGERFGSNSVVTQVHLQKINSFPKIGMQNNKQLQEFGDLLLELQCAKNDGRIKGLQILDEPAYLRPIVAKLPADLQGRWQKHAFKYKTQQVVDYPPFAEFSRFIQEVAKERNDPYLTLESCDESDSFHGISTAKTAVTTPEIPEKVKSVESPDKWCFLHERPHPLRVCSELRSTVNSL